MKTLVYFFVLLLHSMSAAGSGGPPPPVYDLPGFIDLTYQPPEYAEIHYGAMSRYGLLLNHYFPGQTEAKEPVPSMHYRFIDNEKQSYIKEARPLLADRGVDASALSHQENRKAYYFSGDNPSCISNTAKSALSFLRAALSDSNLGKDSYLQLAQVRLSLFDLCYSRKIPNPDAVLNATGALPEEAGNYGAYLKAAAYFYRRDYARALAIFRGLAENVDSGWAANTLRFVRRYAPNWIGSFKFARQLEQAWLKETAEYMIGRIQLIRAQENWDGYSDPREKGIDQSLLAASHDAFNAYLERYPDGLYRTSAIGFERKIAYLAGDSEKLNRMLRQRLNDALALAGKKPDNFSSAYGKLTEFRRFFTGEPDFGADHPLLLAYFVLNQAGFSADMLPELEKRKQDFAHYDGLFDFLKAVIYFRQRRFTELLSFIPEPDRLNGNAATIASAVLRAQALEALGKADESIGIWRKLNAAVEDDIAQLHLAGMYVGTGNYAALLGGDSGIVNPRIQADFLHFAMESDELVDLAASSVITSEARTLVEQELFRRYLLAGQFDKLAGLYRIANKPGPYVAVRQAALTLARKKNDANSLTEVGLFIYFHHLTPESPTGGMTYVFEPDGFDDILLYCARCRRYAERTKELRTAYDFLTQAAAGYKKQGEKTEYEAKTLHYLTVCFRGSEFRHRCQWDRNYENTGKDWFIRLHRKYPRSSWTKRTPYYY